MGSGAEKKTGSAEVCCVAGLAPALLQSDVRIPLTTAFEYCFRESDSYHVISKYKQSDCSSRFLVMLSQQAQDFGRSVPDPYPS